MKKSIFSLMSVLALVCLFTLSSCKDKASSSSSDSKDSEDKTEEKAEEENSIEGTWKASHNAFMRIVGEKEGVTDGSLELDFEGHNLVMKMNVRGDVDQDGYAFSLDVDVTAKYSYTMKDDVIECRYRTKDVHVNHITYPEEIQAALDEQGYTRSQLEEDMASNMGELEDMTFTVEKLRKNDLELRDADGQRLKFTRE